MPDQEYPSVKERLLKAFEPEIKAGAELNGRYVECDRDGHKEFVDGRCSYCFRREHYPTPQASHIAEENARIHLLQRPVNAQVVLEVAEVEIAGGRTRDFLFGVERLVEEEKKKQR